MRKFSIASLLVCAAMVVSACTPGGPAPITWKVKPATIKVVTKNSQVTAGDRPYVIQVGFRSKLGVPGSSAASISSQCRSGALPEPDAAPAGTTVAVPAGSADIPFAGAQNLDIGDVLLQTAPFEIFGTLSFVMNRNAPPFVVGCAISDLLDSALVPVMKQSLDILIAGSAVPPTQEQLIDLIVSNLGNFLSAAGSFIVAILEGFGNPDAIVGVGVQLLLPTAGVFTGLLDTAFSVASIFNEDLAGGFIPLPALPSAVKIRVGPLDHSTAVFDFDGPGGHYIYTSTVGT
ncbi:MAG: hypothetical protein K1X38_16860 [Microthrixaceae bacterium]|nr:hypothetical protein [Microthrixaceae bacterium]